MKALVLCGGIPQIALLQDLKRRGITTVLADMNESVAGRAYADIFYPTSVLDVEGVKEVAIKEKVDFIITVCADQVLLVVAEVSEMLGLPCYIDHKTAVDVSNKICMKTVFRDNGIPTSKFVITETLDPEDIKDLKYPLIVKPVDSYSSRGVAKVTSYEELVPAFANAVKISRTHNAIVEEFVEGDEISVDIYVENGKAHVLCSSNLDKIGEGGKFIIHRTVNPANVSSVVEEKIEKVAQGIADAFGLKDSPMLIQMIVSGDDVSVVEFCARTGGGDKFRLIEKVSGFDVVGAVADITLGIKPHYEKKDIRKEYIINEFLYCNPGVFDHLEGFEELLADGIITEYFQLKTKGVEFKEINSSGDRVAYFTVQAYSREEALAKHAEANKRIKAVDAEGKDLIRHDLVAKIG